MSQPGPTPPHSLEAEKECIGAILVDVEALDVVASVLDPEDFFFERHKAVFRTMLELQDANKVVDPVTIRQHLLDAGTFERIGGARAIGEVLDDRVGTVANVEHYAGIVKGKAKLRRMIDTARSIEVGGYQADDVDEYMLQAERSFFAALESEATKTLTPVSGPLRSTLERIGSAYVNEGGVLGMDTGLLGLDGLTHGLQDQDLVVIAARPAMGKTAFGVGLGLDVALRHGAVAVFSLEMGAEPLVLRMVASGARVSMDQLKTGALSPREWRKIAEAANRVASSRLFIDDTPAITPTQIRAKCIRLNHRHPLRLVIVDYLQLMRGVGKHGSREQEVASFSRALKGLAKELRCPVIALAQLNRELEKRADKRPMMSDLRESGAIEQDADIIAFLYREEVYNKSCPEEQRGIAELILGKHRNGATGTVVLRFRRPWTRFENSVDDEARGVA